MNSLKEADKKLAAIDDAVMNGIRGITKAFANINEFEENNVLLKSDN